MNPTTTVANTTEPTAITHVIANPASTTVETNSQQGVLQTPENREVKMVTILTNLDNQELFPKGIFPIIYAYANTLKHVVDYLDNIPSQNIMNLMGIVKTIELVDGDPLITLENDGSSNYDRYKRICNGFPNIDLRLQGRLVEYRPGTLSDEAYDKMIKFLSDNVDNVLNDKLIRDGVFENIKAMIDAPEIKKTYSNIINEKFGEVPLYMEACLMTFSERVLKGDLGARILLMFLPQIFPAAAGADREDAFNLAVQIFFLPNLLKFTDQLKEIDPLCLGNFIKNSLDSLVQKQPIARPTIEVIEEKTSK